MCFLSIRCFFLTSEAFLFSDTKEKGDYVKLTLHFSWNAQVLPLKCSSSSLNRFQSVLIYRVGKCGTREIKLP